MNRRRSGIRLWLLAFVGFWLLHAAWSFATPLNGPPDELQHVIRAAGVGRGEIIAPAEGIHGYQNVPKTLNRGWCFPTKVEVAASCEPEPVGDETAMMVNTTAARYNPVYYLVSAWPVAVWPNWTGIMLSRLINGALMAALLACAVVAAARWFGHKGIVAGVAVALTPMIAHLGGAINPAGIEIAAGVALFAALIPLLHEKTGEVNRAQVALAAVSAGVLVTPRFTGLMWLLIILGVLLVPASRARLRELARSPAVWLASGFVVLCVAASLAWTLVARTAEPAGWEHGLSVTTILRFAVFEMWPNVANQMIGVMGWAETLMPRLVYVVWFMAAGLVLLGGLIMGSRVDRWRLIALFVGTFAPLLALEILSANQIGFFNQGRYFLPGAVGLPMLAAWIMARRGLPAEQQRSITRLVLVLLLPVQLICLPYTMARWNSGLVSLNPYNGSWEPPYGNTLPLVLVTVAVGVLFVTFWRAAGAPEPVPPAEPEHEDASDVTVDEPVKAGHA
ncbi:MAG TPA: DUF2142 domain-containing protein [Actinophytocola sp.]|uniref:DUF2142 domain-containing protein n=1 Tax=Actinophytocola sp. TaxID=1872138 RepID=UPI002DBAA0EE|nr:DUF2142 domain-containing protein [Actinophytocola sp.]HEU5471769.1 DUF2142 domain-containing protein [Actinophytocola sp.]